MKSTNYRLTIITSVSVFWYISPLSLFLKDLTHLNNTEVPVVSQQFAVAEGHTFERQKRAAEEMEPVQGWLPYLQDPCDPNPCQNDGVCVNVKGRPSCRYHRSPPCLPWLSFEPNGAGSRCSERQTPQVWVTVLAKNSGNVTALQCGIVVMQTHLMGTAHPE